MRLKKEDIGWRVKVLYGMHNHKRSKMFLEHAYVGRLSSEEKTMFGHMVDDNKVKPVTCCSH